MRSALVVTTMLALASGCAQPGTAQAGGPDSAQAGGPDSAQAGGPDSAQAGGPDTSRLDGSWELRSGSGPGGRLEPTRRHRVTLVVNAGEVSGTAACNGYGAPVSRSGDGFRIGTLWTTEMACAAAVMRLEAAYLAALGEVDTAARTGDRLILAGPRTTLTYDRLPPVRRAPLVGTPWVLDALLSGTGPDGTASSTVGTPARLVLRPDGTVTGSTGCRSFTGEYVVEGDSLSVRRLDAEPRQRRACRGALQQDGQVRSVLDGRVRVRVTGDRLTLTSASGLGLVYRAATVR